MFVVSFVKFCSFFWYEESGIVLLIVFYSFSWTLSDFVIVEIFSFFYLIHSFVNFGFLGDILL